MAKKCTVFFSCSDFQHRRDSSVEEKRERLVGLDLGESLCERLGWPWALELEWDLDKQR